MGNCNFRADTEKDSHQGRCHNPECCNTETQCSKITVNQGVFKFQWFHQDVLISICFSCSYQQKSLLVQLRDRKRGIWKGVEGRVEEGEEVVRYERNVKS